METPRHQHHYVAIYLHAQNEGKLGACLAIATYIHHITVSTLHEVAQEYSETVDAHTQLSTARTSWEVGGEDVCRVSKGLGSSPQHLHLLGRLPHIHILHTTGFLKVPLALNINQQSLASAVVQTLSLQEAV